MSHSRKTTSRVKFTQDYQYHDELKVPFFIMDPARSKVNPKLPETIKKTKWSKRVSNYCITLGLNGRKFGPKTDLENRIVPFAFYSPTCKAVVVLLIHGKHSESGRDVINPSYQNEVLTLLSKNTCFKLVSDSKSDLKYRGLTAEIRERLQPSSDNKREIAWHSVRMSRGVLKVKRKPALNDLKRKKSCNTSLITKKLSGEEKSHSSSSSSSSSSSLHLAPKSSIGTFKIKINKPLRDLKSTEHSHSLEHRDSKEIAAHQDTSPDAAPLIPGAVSTLEDAELIGLECDHACVEEANSLTSPVSIVAYAEEPSGVSSTLQHRFFRAASPLENPSVLKGSSHRGPSPTEVDPMLALNEDDLPGFIL